MMQVFTTITPSYQHSAELGLALRMFRRALPANARLELIESDSREQSAGLLRAALARWLQDDPAAESVLIVREPSLILGPDAVPLLRQVLERHPELDCVLPSDARGYRPGQALDYCSLRGLERFVAGLQNPADDWQGYDGREPFIFLLRRSRLEQTDLPEDVFELPARLGGACAVALNAYAHLNLNYYEESRAEMVDLVPEGVRSLLDIGCAGGNFGHALKTARGVRVVGLEMNPIEAARARQRLDRVWVGDALQLNPDERFDGVTCLDSLEHFPLPEPLLQRITGEFLKPGGYFLASIPNVGHWSVVEDLLAGRWDYIPVGLLCNTHFRFFTLDSFTKLLREFGLEPLRHTPVRIPAPAALRRRFEGLAAEGMEIDLASLDTLQYHVLARLGGA